LAKGTFVLWLLRQENEKEFTLENRTKLNELPGIKMAELTRLIQLICKSENA
jgi:hypothetical protein